MDVVLKKIHYNSEVFSKIVEDFEAFVACTKPGTFYTCFVQRVKASPKSKNLIYDEMITDKLEEGLEELRKEPDIYREDFYQVSRILEGADPEEEFYKWIDPLPCHLYIFYHTVMRILWNRNCQRYTTALRDTGEASLLCKN